MPNKLAAARTILAVDTAKLSGWCVFQDGRYVESGVCDAFGDEPRRICARAVELDRKAVLVLEKPFGGNLATITGLGAARGCWLSAWNAAHGRKTGVVSVYPQTWRAELFGDGSSFALREDLTFQLTAKRKPETRDEAAATCIGKWATWPALRPGRTAR